VLTEKAITNGWGGIDQRSVIISYGFDLVDIKNIYVTGSNEKTVKVSRRQSLLPTMATTFNSASRNGTKPSRK
jgi:hypothetical protein